MWPVLWSGDPALWTVWHKAAQENTVSADFTSQLLGASAVKTNRFSYCTLLPDFRQRAPMSSSKCGQQNLCELCFFVAAYCNRWLLLRTGSVQCDNGCVWLLCCVWFFFFPLGDIETEWGIFKYLLAGKPDLLEWKSRENISVDTKAGGKGKP